MSAQGWMKGLAIFGAGASAVGASRFFPDGWDPSSLWSLLSPALERGKAVEASGALLDAVDGKLERVMSRLEAAALANKSAPTVHVIGGGGGGGDRPGTLSSLLTVVVVAGLGGVTISYLWKGKYVTREHFATAVHTVSEGLTGVSKAVDGIKESTKKAINSLSGRVEDSIELQAELRDTVDDIGADLRAVRQVVAVCEAYLTESTRKQDVTLRGVQLLCGVVAESLPQGAAGKRRLAAFVETTDHLLPLEANGSGKGGREASRSERRALRKQQQLERQEQNRQLEAQRGRLEAALTMSGSPRDDSHAACRFVARRSDSGDEEEEEKRGGDDEGRGVAAAAFHAALPLPEWGKGGGCGKGGERQSILTSLPRARGGGSAGSLASSEGSSGSSSEDGEDRGGGRGGGGNRLKEEAGDGDEDDHSANSESTFDEMPPPPRYCRGKTL